MHQAVLERNKMLYFPKHTESDINHRLRPSIQDKQTKKKIPESFRLHKAGKYMDQTPPEENHKLLQPNFFSFLPSFLYFLKYFPTEPLPQHIHQPHDFRLQPDIVLNLLQPSQSLSYFSKHRHLLYSHLSD